MTTSQKSKQVRRSIDKHTRAYMDAQIRYNDALTDMILAGLNKIESYARNKIVDNLQAASVEFKNGMKGDMKAIKRGQKLLASAERTAKVCLTIANGLVKLAAKLS